MITTVKTAAGRVDTQPLPISGKIFLMVRTEAGAMAGLEITPDEAGALIFGMESALDDLEARRAMAAAIQLDYQ